MSEPIAVSATAAPEKASFWEDLIDIFYQPSAVFARRRTASAWPPFLFVVLALSIITFATFSTISPAIESDIRRAMTKAMEQNPQMTQEMADKAIEMQSTFGRYAAIVLFSLSVFIVGLFTWLLSKIFSAKEDFSAAMLIASYAYMPRVLGAIAAGVMGLLMDPGQLTSASVLSLSPARFFDAATTSPFKMALLTRLDLTLIWETVLLAIGVAVIGRVPRGKAIAFGVLMWIVGGLYLLRNAYMMS
ncbi:MAG TPA: YIP1 family protein [Gemmatimonadaceae bacterium]|jgi:type IV secretory pathway TrbD component|nr:YIP1 family protein [Gemmatimonadaceae bacterium]